MKKLLLLLSFILSSCAVVEPLDVNRFNNIAELSDEMAKNYTPGVMKLTTYSGMNTSKYDTDSFTSVTFKVKGEINERENIQNTYQAYCSKFRGDFKEKNSEIFPSMKLLFCNKDDVSSLFSVIIDASPYNESNTLRCFSVLAVENKSMNRKNFADQVLNLDQSNINKNFYSNKGC